MLRIMLEAWGLTLIVGLLGAALGFGLELVLGQAGWALVGVSIGLCGGAMLAGARATPRRVAAQRPQPTTASTE